MNLWIAVAIAIVAGVLLGSIAGRIARRMLGDPARPEAIRQVAPAVGSFLFAAFTATGLLTAISMTSPDSLKSLPKSLVSYFPKAIVAGVLILVANVAGTLAAMAVKSALVRATGEARPGPPRMVRIAILATGIILAVGQLGVNTAIVNMMIAALLFGVAGTAVLLIGLGGLDVARNVAAGRYVARILPVGCQVDSESVTGTVRKLHPATVEIVQTDGVVVHVPHAKVLGGTIRVQHQPEPDAEGSPSGS